MEGGVGGGEACWEVGTVEEWKVGGVEGGVSSFFYFVLVLFLFFVTVTFVSREVQDWSWGQAFAVLRFLLFFLLFRFLTVHISQSEIF